MHFACIAPRSTENLSTRGDRFAYDFLNKFSNACLASLGRKLAGVDVSFSRVTRIS